jgi:two-component system chemotaxis response regulator CheY
MHQRVSLIILTNQGWELIIKVLVVDDQGSMRDVISHMLRQLGFRNVFTATDGIVAYRMLKSGDFDFVVSDWYMPNMTGIQLLKAIRKNDNIKSLPVLLVTAENQKKQIMEAAKSGVNSFIVKPFSASQLENKIKIIFPNWQPS